MSCLLDKLTFHLIKILYYFSWIQKITEAAEKANHLKKVQQKPLPAIPAPPPPPALEETPENLLNSPPEITPAPANEEPAAPEPEEETPQPQDDPNAVSTTQPCQLIQPSEISIAAQTVQEASLVVTPQEGLRRRTEQIRVLMNECKQIYCDQNHLPIEHFSAVADIASQPEAKSDLSDLSLAIYAQVNVLVEGLRTAILSNGNPVANPSSISGPALCDNCAVPSEFRSRSVSEPVGPSNSSGVVEVETGVETNNADIDNLYCEIEPLKDDKTIAQRKITSHMEINENYSGAGERPSNTTNNIVNYANLITTLNCLVSQLTVSLINRLKIMFITLLD